MPGWRTQPLSDPVDSHGPLEDVPPFQGGATGHDAQTAGREQGSEGGRHDEANDRGHNLQEPVTASCHRPMIHLHVDEICRTDEHGAEVGDLLAGTTASVMNDLRLRHMDNLQTGVVKSVTQVHILAVHEVVVRKPSELAVDLCRKQHTRAADSLDNDRCPAGESLPSTPEVRVRKHGAQQIRIERLI